MTTLYFRLSPRVAYKNGCWILDGVKTAYKDVQQFRDIIVLRLGSEGVVVRGDEDPEPFTHPRELGDLVDVDPFVFDPSDVYFATNTPGQLGTLTQSKKRRYKHKVRFDDVVQKTTDVIGAIVFPGGDYWCTWGWSECVFYDKNVRLFSAPISEPDGIMCIAKVEPDLDPGALSFVIVSVCDPSTMELNAKRYDYNGGHVRMFREARSM